MATVSTGMKVRTAFRALCVNRRKSLDLRTAAEAFRNGDARLPEPASARTIFLRGRRSSFASSAAPRVSRILITLLFVLAITHFRDL